MALIDGLVSLPSQNAVHCSRCHRGRRCRSCFRPGFAMVRYCRLRCHGNVLPDIRMWGIDPVLLRDEDC